jgi:hypothetical protein
MSTGYFPAVLCKNFHSDLKIGHDRVSRASRRGGLRPGQHRHGQLPSFVHHGSILIQNFLHGFTPASEDLMPGIRRKYSPLTLTLARSGHLIDGRSERDNIGISPPPFPMPE